MDRVAGVESVIDRAGNYHLHTNGYGPTSLRHIWLDLWEGSGARPFVINNAKDASLTTRGPVPFYGMKVSKRNQVVPYTGTMEIHFSTETWNGILLFDKVTITRLDPDRWSIEASEEENVKLTDRDRQVLGTYAMPFALTIRHLPWVLR